MGGRVTAHEGYCRDCEAPIYWLISNRNRNTPIDRAPTLHGNLVIDLTEGTWRHATPTDRFLDPTGLHVAHFVTCPAAHTRRRPR